MACLSVGRLHQLCRKAWCLRYDPLETLVMVTLANPTLHTHKYALLSIRTVRLPLTASISMYIAYTHMNTHHSSFFPPPPLSPSLPALLLSLAGAPGTHTRPSLPPPFSDYLSPSSLTCPRTPSLPHENSRSLAHSFSPSRPYLYSSTHNVNVSTEHFTMRHPCTKYAH